MTQLLKQYKPFAFEHHRHKVVYGGRGKGVSWQFASILVLLALQKRLRILCTREIQNSLADSVFEVIKTQIERLGVSDHYKINKTGIISSTGSAFLFKGLRHNIDSIKSTEGIDICWIAEGDKVPQDSWDKLLPTIRKEGSEIWVDYNTDAVDDPVHDMFVIKQRPDSLVLKQTYRDNPKFPDVLRQEMEYDREYDYDKYLWIWEGNTREFTEACVFNGKFRVDDFETPEDAEFFHGADWGFAQDPTTLIRCYVKDGCLYIDREAWGVHIEVDNTPELFNTIETAKDWQIIGDNARPEIISYLRQHGFRKIKACRKGKGSIEDGVERLRSFKQIIVHQRCKHIIEEFKLYSYKRNKLTGEIMPIIEDKHNHGIDALRYATEEIGRRRMKIVRYA